MFGIDKHGQPTGEFQPGIELHGKYVFIAEGARGSLAKTVMARHNLCDAAEPQKYGIGLTIDAEETDRLELSLDLTIQAAVEEVLAGGMTIRLEYPDGTVRGGGAESAAAPVSSVVSGVMGVSGRRVGGESGPRG